MVDSDTKDDVRSLCVRADVSAASYKRFPGNLRWATTPETPPPQLKPPVVLVSKPTVALPPKPPLVQQPKLTAVQPSPIESIDSEAPVASDDAGTFPLSQLAAIQPASFLPAFALVKEKTLTSLDKAFERSNDAAARSRQPQTRLQPIIWPVLCAAGGCGTTTVLATLGRALSILGESVLLVDAGGSPTLPLYFGGETDERGLLCFRSQSNRFEGAVHVFRALGEEDGPVYRAMAQLSSEVQRVLLAPTQNMRDRMGERLWLDRACLIVITPELRSVLAIEPILQQLNTSVKAYFLLNRFDPTKPLHKVTRDKLAAQLGDRLLPIVLPEANEVAEALASGLTVVDADPRCAASEAYFQLAAWLRAVPDGGQA